MAVWTPSGAPVMGQNRFNTSLTLNVTPTAGDILVMIISNDFGGQSPIITLGGTAVTTWKQFGQTAGNLLSGPNGSSGTTSLGVYWVWGVANGGATTITMSTSNNGTAAIVQGFTVMSTASEDTPHGTTNAPPTALSGNYAAESASVSGELFVAGLASRFGGTPGGATSGFTYISFRATFIGGLQMVYSTNAVGAQSPAWSFTAASDYTTFDGFLKPGAPVASGNFFLVLE